MCPSRSGLLALSEQSQPLQGAGVHVVSIHVGSPSEQATAWLNDNAIRFPAGSCSVDLPILERTWGVQSLPWLILTDAEHRVVAEGLSVVELDQRIAAGQTHEE